MSDYSLFVGVDIAAKTATVSWGSTAEALSKPMTVQQTQTQWSKLASKLLEICPNPEEYDDDMKGLIALYILTTSVEPMETIATFGHPKSMVYERIKGIRDRLQRVLKEYEPIQSRTWQERLVAGEVESYLQVDEHYHDRSLALFALYTLTTETKVRRFARDDKERKMIFYYRKKCLKRIEAAYGQAATF